MRCPMACSLVEAANETLTAIFTSSDIIKVGLRLGETLEQLAVNWGME